MLTRTAAAIAAVALVATACADDPGVTVETARVSSGEVVETVAAPATLAPRDRVTVTSPVAGEIAEVLVDDGDRVGIGTPLLRLASDSLDLQIAQAEAAVEAADALGSVTAGVDLSPIVKAVREQLEVVIPGVLDTLAEQVEALPEEQQEAATERIDEALADYEASQERLLAAERSARSQAAAASSSQRAAAEAQRRQAELALEAAREVEGELVISAPIAGVVQLEDAESASGLALPDLDGSGDGLGSLGGLLGGGGGTSPAGPIAVGVAIGAGQPLVTVFDLAGFHAEVAIDEIDAVLVAEGQEALVLVDAFPEVELAGRVEHVAIEPVRGDTGGVVFPVRVAIDLPDDLPLRVGLTASTEIVVSRVDAELVVPSSALLRRGGQEVVYVARDGTAVEVEVEVLAIGDGTAAIDGALEVGEEVVTVGIEGVADGTPLP